ncbi:porin [Pedobacter endophyticus]|uniref:Porin n=1 Tax=Pedobacter endophyticus TaxID=2789740 RepID=A0A7S9L2F8_9SPHI|nr:porin [Pedobacter endophyticus]QPH41251.1 porin [Pedobacter endophyticus]
MKKLILLITTIIISVGAFAQTESGLKFSGYLEAYYGYDFNNPADHNRPSFVYSHNKANEVNLNLAFIKAAYAGDLVRANFALMSGTYANANLATEPGVLKSVFEANAGLKLSKSEDLWIDAGIFSSHIGFESAISKDCWTLTRNIASENTPYYESGAKVTYATHDKKLTATLLYLNGWQRISRQVGNNKPAGGVQLAWKPTAKITVNYSNYLGTEGADSVGLARFYHNFYGIFQLTDRFGVTAGVDYGTQQKPNGKPGKHEVLSPVLIAQYKLAEKWAVAGRFEYYEDKNGIFIPTETPNGFKTKGYSLNIDYWPIANAVIRVEGKVFDSKDKIFERENSVVNANTTLTASIAVAF